MKVESDIDDIGIVYSTKFVSIAEKRHWE